MLDLVMLCVIVAFLTKFLVEQRGWITTDWEEERDDATDDEREQ